MKLNKKQKRTATIASMAALLAVVLGMGGQTFAKYITTNTAAPQSATVAKWGLVLNQKTSDETLFKKDYNGTVSSTSRVVAPGTTGYVTYAVEGSAEVDAQVTFSMVSYSGVSLTHSAGTYAPIKWTYQYGTGAKTEFIPATDFAFPVLTYNAHDESSITVTIEWTWDFETVTIDSEDADEIKANKEQNNKYDTILGYASKANSRSTFKYDSAVYQEGDNLNYTVDYTLDFQFKAVIEQID